MGIVKPAAALGAAALLVVGMAACSGGDTTAQGSSSPTTTVEAFMHALGNQDASAACSQVSTGGKALVGDAFAQCKVGLESVLGDITDPADLTRLKTAKVTGAQIDGDKATVTKSQISNVPSGYENDIDLVRLDGTWYIDSKP
ncbi:hypothetical protein [Lapillicoccus sp.]|uniref:hypothetical protein n=1 Tax=Lapillicoccus sp. TaxID=1909287 RepID=UPI00326465A4